jgi:hypothetical protein
MNMEKGRERRAYTHVHIYVFIFIFQTSFFIIRGDWVSLYIIYILVVFVISIVGDSFYYILFIY